MDVVYEVSLQFLCQIGYNNKNLTSFTRNKHGRGTVTGREEEKEGVQKTIPSKGFVPTMLMEKCGDGQSA